MQVGAYLLLVEERYGVRPSHGVVVLADGKRVEVENSEDLRSEVIAVAEMIREHRRNIHEEIEVWQPAAKCRACGQFPHCRQSSSTVAKQDAYREARP
jgi:CRISPR-associated exonuclease Cas4